MGLRWRLILYVGVTLALLLIASAAFGLQALNRAQRSAISQHLQLAQAMAEGVERQLDSLSLVVHMQFPRTPSPAQAREYLSSLYVRLASFENLWFFRVSAVRLVNAEGELLAAAPQDVLGTPETLPSLQDIQQVLSEGRSLVLSSRLSRVGQFPFLTVVLPMPPSYDNPQGAAMVVDTTGLGGINPFFPAGMGLASEPGMDDHSYYTVELIGPEGTVLATSGGDDSLGVRSIHAWALREFLARREAGAVVHRGSEGRGHPDHLVAIVPLREAPFFLTVEEPLGLLLDWPSQLQRQALILGVVSFFLVLALGWLVGRQLVRPVVALRLATARIREGDLETPVRVQASGEMAHLAKEVEEMRQRLWDTLSSLDGLNSSLADQVNQRTQQLRTVVAQMMRAQEEERHRVARDLHDEAAQGLTALGIFLDEAMQGARGGEEKVVVSLRDAREQVRRLVAETRRLAYALRPSVLDDAGLVPALRWCAEAYLEAAKVQVSLDAPRPEWRHPEPVEVALYRVGQEAMSNIAKHARASRAWISLQQVGDSVTLTVRDDGVGFEAEGMLEREGAPGFRGFGLLGMKERVDLLGGQFQVVSQPGQGTTVTASVPLGTWEEEKK